ncbi:MAG: aldo/keto reductase [Candidatus Thermoplasmatota archaeon]|nr:aldo/keto reductase [Candidatus Thermoplasmatota archaeon]
MPVLYRYFGRTGVKVSAVGMGTYYDFRWITVASLFGFRLRRAQIVRAIRAGIDAGINLIDTAEFYKSEALVAEAVKGYDREKLFIATKVFPTHLKFGKVIRSCEKSLRRLELDYIDLYQIHFPRQGIPLSETMGAMEKLVDEGKIRHIGISNFSLDKMREAENGLKKYTLASTQMHYNMMHRDVEKEILPHCAENGIALMAYFPVAHGKLAKPAGGEAHSALESVRKKYGLATTAQVGLNYLISKSENVFPIPRASTQEHVLQNAELGGNLFSDEDMAVLAGLFG